jgi:hypothetical protein
MAKIGICHWTFLAVPSSTMDSPFICSFAWLSICRIRRVASNLEENTHVNGTWNVNVMQSIPKVLAFHVPDALQSNLLGIHQW